MKVGNSHLFEPNLDYAGRALRGVAALGLFALILEGYVTDITWITATTLVGAHLAMTAAVAWDPALAGMRAMVRQIRRFGRRWEMYAAGR